MFRVTLKPPVVSLLSYRLHRLLIEDLDKPNTSPTIHVEAGVAKEVEQPDIRVLRLRIATLPPAAREESSIPRIEADLEGRFRVHVEGTEEDIEKALRVYGGAQLYSLLRGLISAPAALFSPNNTVLPSINMQSFMDGAKTIKPPSRRSPAPAKTTVGRVKKRK